LLATPFTVKRGLQLRDKTNKANQPLQQAEIQKKAIVTVSKFAPEQLKTPSPSLRRRLPSPTPGPALVVEESPEEPDFANLEVELAASDPPVGSFVR
jgi:hypothetical protein